MKEHLFEKEWIWQVNIVGTHRGDHLLRSISGKKYKVVAKNIFELMEVVSILLKEFFEIDEIYIGDRDRVDNIVWAGKTKKEGTIWSKHFKEHVDYYTDIVRAERK